MSCEKASQVQAMYDRELSDEQCRELGVHLRECGECRELVADLEQISRFMSSASFAPLPAETTKKLQQAWWAAQSERGVLRVAEWMTGLAAAVLIGAMLLWPGEAKQNTTTVVTASWQNAAVMPPSDVDDEAVAEVIELAQWMANDLSGGVNR